MGGSGSSPQAPARGSTEVIFDVRRGAPSILFRYPADAAEVEGCAAPAFFADLNLDQVVEAATKGLQEYDLRPFFHAPLRTVADIEYRQQVVRELDGTPLAKQVGAFARNMQAVRGWRNLAGKIRHLWPARGWVLDAAGLYCRTVRKLLAELEGTELNAAGLRDFRDYLTRYAASNSFTVLEADAERVREAMSAVRYAMTISGLKVRIRRYEAEEDYSEQVVADFDKFRQGGVKDYRVEYRDTVTVGHIEAQILEKVAKLFPEPFAALERFCADHPTFVDPAVAAFDRQSQFILAWLDYLRPLRNAGLELCYPHVSTEAKNVEVRAGFDIALAYKLVVAEHASSPVVCNDIRLVDGARLLVVTGPNQGGKTTFARSVAQICHLARLGLPVPGTSATVFVCDEIFTHFERGENLGDLRGKLHDDLVRVRDILTAATGDSLIVLNEIFTSTTVADASELSTAILRSIAGSDALVVCVTFLDELASLNGATVSAVAGVDPEDPTRRTFSIEYRPADGRAYAAALAAKHGLTYTRLKKILAAERGDHAGRGRTNGGEL
jgi:DNA mismatch repair protein MutS